MIEEEENSTEEPTQEGVEEAGGADQPSEGDNLEDAEEGVEEEIDYEQVTDDLDGFGDVKLHVTAMIGRVSMPIEQFLKLNRGAILELGKHKDDQIDLYVNDKYVARGDDKIIEDRVGVEIKEPPVWEI